MEMADVHITIENATQKNMNYLQINEWNGKHGNPLPSPIASGTKGQFSHTPDAVGSVAAVVYHGHIGTVDCDHMIMWSSLTSSKDANKVWAMTRERGFFTDTELLNILGNLTDSSHTDADRKGCESYITIVNDPTKKVKTPKVEAKFTFPIPSDHDA